MGHRPVGSVPGTQVTIAPPFLPPSLPFTGSKRGGWALSEEGGWLDADLMGDLHLKTRTCHLAAAVAWRNC